MSSITYKVKGDFTRTNRYLERLKEIIHLSRLDKYGRAGVSALSAATPKDSGTTASSWRYEISHENGRDSIGFYNSNVNEGVPIAIILQYGHGTGTGGWVQGRDYINPAIQPVFDQILDDVQKEITAL